MALAGVQPLKWHGGKAYLADWIISNMPARCKNPNAPAADDPGWLHYVEPFFGGGAVLFRLDPTGISEVINDKSRNLTNFWQVLQSSELFPRFQRVIEAMPVSEPEFGRANATGPACGLYDLDAAIAFFVRFRQSRQGLGKDFATMTRQRTRRGMNEQVSSWLTAVEGLPEAHARLKRVVIYNKLACEVIAQQDGPRTLFYLDPPYLHETRHGKGENKEYECEMSPAEHAAMLGVLTQIEGRFLLSGYRSEMYDQVAAAAGWRRVDKEIDNKASGAKSKEKKVECLWMNF